MTSLAGTVGRSMSLQRKVALTVLIAVGLLAVNVPPALAFVSEWRHEQLIGSPEYTAQNGRWDVIELPADMQVNAIHAALLPTGKLLIVAGSGNDQQQFDAKTFKTLLYDPANGQTKLVPTPDDLFCAGHTFLTDGKLLVAGGTARYEVLADKVTRVAGSMTVKNENPADKDKPRTFLAGTEFVHPDGTKYRATRDFVLPPARKAEGKRAGQATLTPGVATVWVEAVGDGAAYVRPDPAQYTITGLPATDVKNIYGTAQKLTLDKQEFHGIRGSWEFDPVTESYQQVDNMDYARWYPTLAPLPDGRVLAVSGLDETGQVLTGQNEIYDPKTRQWAEDPDLFQYFPTYPALFQTAQAGTLFYTGSNAGYGPDNQGRVPGFWNLQTNTITPVPGLRDPDLMETSSSMWVGPVQSQKIMVVGGGGVGESPVSSKRIDVIDLSAPQPRFTPGPDLPEGTRYPSTVILPDDTTLITGGSRDYRGKGGSDNHNTRIYHPDTNTLSLAADHTVGRNYHSEALLLPDGRVMALGSDPLFRDKEDTEQGRFEKRLEIFTPAYLFHGTRPTITDAPKTVTLGGTMQIATPDPATVGAARLIRPSAVTHVTDVDQRSIALELAPTAGGLALTLPKEPTLVPPGFYMLFLTGKDGTPSVARWVQVV